MSTISTPASLRKFGFLLSFIFMVIIGLALPALFQRPFPMWTWYVGLALLAFALLQPTWLAYLYHPWMKVGELLGWVNTRIILTGIFFTFVTPLGILLRLLRHDPLMRKWDKEARSYRRTTPPKSIQHMEKPF